MWAFLENSSMLGVSHTGKSWNQKQRYRGFFWAIVTIILWVITGYLLSDVFVEYFQYNVLTTITVESQPGGVEFPTVVICNHNPIKCRELFKISLKRPDIWKASGCLVGVQIERYVEQAILDYNVLNGFPIPREFTEKAADGSQPLVDYWAHLYVDSKEIVNMLFDIRTHGTLLGLKTFIAGSYVEVRQKWKNKRDMENHHAVIHLEAAIRGHHLRTRILPAVVAANSNGTELTSIAIRRLFAQSYLDTFSGINPDEWKNSSGEGLKAAWIEAVVNGTIRRSKDFSNQLLDISRGFMKFQTDEVSSVYEVFPSLLWLYGDPRIMMDAKAVLFDNLDSMMVTPPATTQSLNIDSIATTLEPLPSRATMRPISGTFDIVTFAGRLTYLSLTDQVAREGDIFRDLLLNSLDAEMFQLMYNSVGDFMQGCTMQGVLCQESWIRLHNSLKYGICLEFNPMLWNGTESKPPLTSSIEGSTGGLNVRFDIAESEYIRVPQQVSTEGVRVGIFPYGAPPNIDADGFNVMPGQSVDIQLKPLYLKRLPSPYPSGCANGWSSTSYSYSGYQYDLKTCLRFCVGHQIAVECECLDPQSNAHQIEYKGSKFELPWCNISKPAACYNYFNPSFCKSLYPEDTRDAVCIKKLKVAEANSNPTDGMKNSQFECPCRPACDSSSYSMQVSSAAFPAKGFMEKYAEEAKLHPFKVQEEWQSIKDSLLEVNIYFSSFDLTKTEESPQHTIFSTSSDVGGALGLLLGLCGFNIIEILVMLWDMTIESMAKRARKSKTAKESCTNDVPHRGYPTQKAAKNKIDHIPVHITPDWG